MAIREKEIDRFEAVDAEGKDYTIVQYMEVVDPASKGKKSYRTPQGVKVTKISDSVFEILDYKPIRVRRVPGR